MRIAQLANFYSPTSGGLRTAVDTIGRGYLAAGHERVLIRPGRYTAEAETGDGLVVTLRGRPVSGGYRMVLAPRAIRAALDRVRPDSVEVSDKATMVTAGMWARDHDRPAVLFSHERLDTWLAARLPILPKSVLEPLVARWNRRLAARFDTVVVTSAFAEQEFRALGVRHVRRVPLGVDLATFHPSGPPDDTTARLVYAGRLSPEKNPVAVIKAVDVLVRNGNNVTLDVYGHGSALPALKREAKGLPVTFHGHLSGRAELAARLAAADVAFAPSPAETFGLSILEALACGTPVVTADTGGAPELVSGGAGLAVRPTPEGLAGGVLRVLSRPVRSRRAAARRRAESYPWSATVRALVDLHAMTTGAGTSAGKPR